MHKEEEAQKWIIKIMVPIFFPFLNFTTHTYSRNEAQNSSTVGYIGW